MGRDQPGPQGVLRQPRPSPQQVRPPPSGVLDLAERTGDGFLPMAFGTAESCHANFYNDWMDQEHLETYLPGIQRLVRQLLDVRASDAGGNHE